MSKILVSIISDQTIPNVLVIKDMQGHYDDLLFITTDYVEKKGLDKWVELGCGIKESSVTRIKVVEDDLNDIRNKLKSLDLENTQYVVNMSGGTKIMTIGVYEFFAKNNNKIIYVPIGKNSISEVFPNCSIAQIPIKYRLNLMEYLTSYGLHYEPSRQLLKPADFTKRLFKSLKSKKFNLKNEELIHNAHSFEDNNDKAFFSGSWFEEYIYSKVMDDFKLETAYIGLNVQLRRDNCSTTHDNEYDVVFVKNNELYVIEAKVSVGNEKYIKDNLEKYMYKLAAITRDFGLRVHSAIFTLSDTKSLLKGKFEGVQSRQKILGIKTISDKQFFIKNESLKTLFINY